MSKINNEELKAKFRKINNEIKLKEQKQFGFKDEFLAKFEKEVIKKEMMKSE